ncbi:hypothetical protein HYV79_04860 [Candidatus Woesearchaeota archaeon]|nr:hypothetical protein [Candidatus Woesearchaeota archaeon]
MAEQNAIPEKDEVFEAKVLEVAGITLIALSVLFVLLYKLFFESIPEFTTKYSWHIVYLIFTVVANATVIYHLKAYRNAVTCMAGMMIGMTIGMISGLSIGFLVGATNGMFTGALYGMIVGMITGAWCGKCCGIMGVMEGIMAGLMGGTMGAMLSVMLINDRLLIFTPIFILSCTIILAGLGYMVYKEHSVNDEKVIKPYPLTNLVFICFLITVITILVMLYGPKSALFL